MKKRTLFCFTLFLPSIFLIFGCTQSVKVDHPAQKSFPKYAKLFYISEENGYKEAFVKDPWDSTKILAHYVFIPKNERNSSSIYNATIVRTPCESVACLSSPEIGFVSRLGLVSNVTGVSQIEYIKDSLVLQQVASGKTIDLGPFEAYNIELLMALNPEVLFAAPFKESKYDKIIQTGVPIAYCSSYMEESPLGRAEWIKFIALFFDKYDQACQIFNEIEKNYQSASALAKSLKQKPTVFSGKMFQNTWFVSGLNSYMAQFFTDAGGEYLWQDLKFSGSEPIGFERVYERCHASDYWVILEYAPGGYSYQKLITESDKYKNFEAYKNKKIILCNTYQSSYYEKGIIEPEVILKDFVKIFHPELLPEYKSVYFELLTHEK